VIKQLVIEIKDEKEGEDIFFDRVLFAEVWNPAIDIYETDEAIILLIELPGVKPADMNLSLNKQQNVLHIWGKRKSPLKTEGKNCHTMELHFGTFSRYVKLLAKVKVDKAELENMNGIFKITFKKKK
jgi:HSP20 family protein